MLQTAGMLCLALSAPLPGPGGELEEALGLLDELRVARASVHWQETSLAEALGELDERTGIPLRADWRALDRLGVRRSDEVTLKLVSAPLSTILAAVSLQLGDEYERPVLEAHAGQIVLTTREATTAMCLTDVYDVRDLLADGEALRALRAEAPAATAPEESEPAGSGQGQGEPAQPAEPTGDDETPPAEEEGEEEEATPGLEAPSIDEVLRDAPPAAPPTPGEELMLFIADHVDPDAWIEMGGTRATIGERDGVLLVTAPPTTHRKFRDALARLRRAVPSSVLIEAAIVDLPRATFRRLAGRYDKSSAALGRSILLAEDLAVHWQAVSAVALDERLSIESEDAGVVVTLGLSPRLDKETGLLSIDLEATSRRGEDRRSMKTTVTMPFRQGASVLELPGATAGDSVRLIVLIPERM